MERKTLLQEVIDTLVEREGVSRSVADTFGHAFFEVIEEALRNDKFVKVKGFGTFKLVPVSERESVNVNTGERIQIGSHSKVTFTPDAYLRDLVNKPFSHFQTTVLNDDTTIDELEAADELIPAEPEVPEPPPAEEAPAARVETAEAVDSVENVDSTEEVEKIEKDAPSVEAPELEESELEKPATEEPAYKIEDETIPDTPPAYHIDAATEQEEQQESSDQEQEQELEQEQQADQPEAIEEESEPTEDIAEESAEGTAEEGAEEEAEEEATEEEEEEEEVPFYPTRRRRIKWWKLLAALLFILLLMFASYFAGYFRVFCPPCETAAQEQQAAKEQQAAPQQPAATPAEPTQPAVPDSTKSATSTAEETDEAQTADKTKQEADKAKPEKKTYNPAIHYEISGLRETYTVKLGDGIYRIAAKIYGNKELAPYIIKYNKMRDPDNIVVGTVLKIPELVEPTKNK